jgi:DNA-binding response OmpR family regulator
MAGRHVALVIEDEPEMAAEIADLVRSFGHDHIHAETLADARVRLDQGGFCYVLLDLQIKADGQSIKPRVESGMSLLREIRKRFPHRNADDMHLMPVIVISAHGKEPRNIIGAYDGGIDGFILKPLSIDGQDIGAKIRLCLERAGRSTHDACAGCGEAAATGESGTPHNGQTFWHSSDYSEIRLLGEPFAFTGDVNRAVIRLLHEAAVAGQPWQSGKAILAKAGSQDAEGKMANLFGDHPSWGKLLLSNRRGKYRLRTE